MRLDLIPRQFFTTPRFPRLWDEDDDFWSVASQSSGLAVSEDDKNVYVEAAVPGLDPEKIEVTYEKGVLWIRGEQAQEEKDEQKKFYRRAASSFSYRVAVPGDVDEGKEPAVTCKNGMLKATFAKRPEVQPKKLTVKAE